MIHLFKIKRPILPLLALLLILVSPVANYAQREFKKESIEEYKKNKAYDYFKQKQLKPEKEKEVKDSSSESGGSVNIGGGVKIILIILFIGIIGYIIYAIVSGNKGFKNYSDDKLKDTVIEQVLDEEKIEENDFDSLLQLALSKEEYRTALRIMFLKSLQILNQKEIILYAKNKTNYEYLSEIRKEKLKPIFQQASDSFSWIWYANTHESVDQTVFLQLEPHFKALLKEVE